MKISFIQIPLTKEVKEAFKKYCTSKGYRSIVGYLTDHILSLIKKGDDEKGD